MQKKKSFFREMTSFTENGRFKSSFFVYAVGLSFLFIVVHVIILALLLEPLHLYFTSFTVPLSGWWLNLFEGGIPALLSALLCNTLIFFIRDKRLIFAAYVMVALYVVIVAVAGLCIYEDGTRTAFMHFLSTVATAPVVCGLLVSAVVVARK